MIREKRLTGLRHQSPLTNSRSRENLFIEFPWRDWIPYFFRVALAAVEFFLEMLSTFLPPVPSTIATLNAPWRTLLLIEEDRSRDQSSRSGRWIHHATSVNWKGLASPMLWVETAFFFRFSLSGPCPGRTVELYGPIWGARSLRSRRVCYFGNSLEKSGDAAGGIYSPVLEMRELVCKFYHRAKLRDCRITDVIYVYAHTHTQYVSSCTVPSESALLGLFYVRLSDVLFQHLSPSLFIAAHLLLPVKYQPWRASAAIDSLSLLVIRTRIRARPLCLMLLLSFISLSIIFHLTLGSANVARSCRVHRVESTSRDVLLLVSFFFL